MVPLALALALAGACNARALIEVDVEGDTPFQGVTLRLTAGGTTKDFAGASFGADPSTAFKAGIYVGDSGDVMVTARALDGSGNCIGIGQSSAASVQAGAVTGPIAITVAHSSSCTGGGSGAGGTTGGGMGGNTGGDMGGMTGGGTGGNTGGGMGGMTGGMGGNTGGMGGTTGSGGQPAGNLVMNGDFANGETSWNLPAMVGSVSHAVTAGAFCVTLSQGASSATVGYPAGGTSPLTINGGTSYRFSYQASVSANNTTLEAKVGQTQTPYDATGSDWPNEPAGPSLQTFTHTFTRGSTDSSMGVAFNLMGGPSTVCIDNVSVTPN